MELTEDQPSFEFTSVVVEVVLVFGTISVKTTEEIIEAPYLLLPEYDEV